MHTLAHIFLESHLDGDTKSLVSIVMQRSMKDFDLPRESKYRGQLFDFNGKLNTGTDFSLQGLECDCLSHKVSVKNFVPDLSVWSREGLQSSVIPFIEVCKERNSCLFALFRTGISIPCIFNMAVLSQIPNVNLISCPPP